METFKNWLHRSEMFEEMTNLKTADTSHVQLDPFGEDFNEKQAREQCLEKMTNEVDIDDYYHRYGVYDDITDDLDFSAQTVEDWEDENPEPIAEDFDDEDFEAAHEKWKTRRDRIETRYKAAVERWRLENESNIEKADQRYADVIKEKTEECFQEKREDHEQGFRHLFKHGNDDYTVDMAKEYKDFGGNNLSDIYNITFEGPNNYNLTNKSGAEANIIYSKLILAVKKLLETQVVNGLYFSAYDKYMLPIYTKFYDTFLKDDFIRVEPNFYVKRDIVKNTLSGFKQASNYRSERLGGDVLKKIYQANRQNLDNLTKIKLMKIQKRIAQKIIPNLVNHFVPIYNYDHGTSRVYLFFVVSVNPSNMKLTGYNSSYYQPFNRTEEISWELVLLPWQEMTPQDFQGDFLQYISNLNFNDLEKFQILKIANLQSPVQTDVNQLAQEMLQKLDEKHLETMSHLPQTLASIKNYMQKFGIQK